MALPVLQTTKYTTIIPSTNETIQFRAFLVKEEKILLMAQESGENSQILSALEDVITACTFNKVDVKKLTSYDLEHIFIQLRMKSVGEIISLRIPCKKCSKLNEIDVDLNDVEISNIDAEPNAKIQLTDSVGIVVRTIPVSEMGNISDKTEDFISTIALCIDSVFDNDKVWTRAELSSKELEDFISSFSREQLGKIENFITHQPKLTYSTTVKCHSCNEDIEISLEGLQDFFQ